jgi:hypothetical protein
VDIVNVDRIEAEVRQAPLQLVLQKPGSDRVHAPGNFARIGQPAGHGARREESGLGADEQLVARGGAGIEQAAERQPDGALRPLMTVIDRRVDDVDTAPDRGFDRLHIALIASLVGLAQVSADADR